tara:strand:- start:39222 stop:40289 length:1068 start_codon:yes stop_codon:yes gene_type:complete
MLTTPYENWEAYKTGVIDKDGKIIVKPNNRSPEQKDSYTKFDNLMLKLKNVLGTIPFGRTKLASYAAALLLLKEQDTLTEENIKERFLDFYKKRYLTEKWSDKYKINEEIANVASSGQVAGLGDDPPVGKKAQTSLIRRGKFANNDTFIVSSDVMKTARMGKKKFVKYEKYVGNGEVGKAIRDFGRKNPKKPIILQDEKTGGMIFLRYGKSGMFEESNPRILKKKDKKEVKEQILEDVTKSDLDKVESYADRLFKAVGIDIEFTRHFLDRVNDARNKKEITVQELASLFKKTFEKYGKKIASLGDDAEAVINDMKSDINMPFVLDLNRRTKELDLIAKTVMRKKNFMTRNLKLKV